MARHAINYNERVFQSVSNTSDGDVGAETVFRYRQDGDLVWGTYSGGHVRFGTLLAIASPEGTLAMRYQHLTSTGEFKAGECSSMPELLADGRVRLHEQWCWTAGGVGSGTSIVEEIVQPAPSRSS